MGRAGAALAASFLLLLAGCASTPEASLDHDAEAKHFEGTPGAATLYVFRNDSHGSPNREDSVLYVDDQVVGATLPGTYFRVEVLAGQRELHGYGHDQGSLRLRAGLGEVHFIALHVTNGGSRFARVAPEAARREIQLCCVLLENWRAGQRPLLR